MAHHNPHILYIDDDQDACLMMTRLLEFSDIRVTCVHGVKDASLLPNKEQFDVFLLDLWLRDGDGDVLCRELRDKFPDIPVVFYSGCATNREMRSGLAAGAAAYLFKPDSHLIAPLILKLTDEGRNRNLNRSGRSVDPWFAETQAAR